MRKYLSTAIFAMSLFVTFNSRAENSSESKNSATNRADKKWGWVGQAGNFTLGNRATFGFGAGLLYYINGDNVLSLEAGTGTNYDFLSSLGGDTVNANDSRIGIYYKTFYSNSFYFKGGIEDSHIHYNVVHYPTFGGPSYSQTADFNLYSVYLGVGNHWQKKSFTIGCDWLAATLPFANSGYTETDEGPEASKWDLKDRLMKPGIIIGRFYIGMSY